MIFSLNFCSFILLLGLKLNKLYVYMSTALNVLSCYHDWVIRYLHQCMQSITCAKSRF